MKTTLNIDDKIIEKASKLTGISEKTALVRKGLEALITQESAKRLATLGVTKKNKRYSQKKIDVTMVLADTSIWTLDKQLQRISKEFGISGIRF